MSNVTWDRLTELRANVLALGQTAPLLQEAELRAEVDRLITLAKPRKRPFSRTDIEQLIAEGKTDAEIAEKTKLSKQRVNQIRHRKASND